MTTREETIERVCKEVRKLCKEADLEFFFCAEGRSEWSIAKSDHLKELVDYHKVTEERRIKCLFIHVLNVEENCNLVI